MITETESHSDIPLHIHQIT